MRIRPLHIALLVLVAGAVYSAAGVVASIAEIRSVGERVAATAARARAERAHRDAEHSPRVEVAPETAHGEADSPASLDLVDRHGAAALEPSTEPDRDDTAADDVYDPAADVIDAAAAEEEERYIESAGRHDDSAISEESAAEDEAAADER